MTICRLMLTAAIAAAVTSFAAAQTPPLPGGAPAATQPPTSPTASASTPSAPNPAYQKAAEALGKNDVEGAIQILDEARKTDKLLKPSRVILAEILYGAGQGQNARMFVEAASNENPNHPDAYILSGFFAAREGRWMDAMLCLEKASVLAGSADHDVDVRRRMLKDIRPLLADVYAQRSDVTNALQQLRLILNDDPRNARIRVNAARLQAIMGNDAAALDDLRTAHKDDPDNPQVGLPEANMGRFWDTKPLRSTKKEDQKAEGDKNRAEAETWYKKALEAYPKDHRAPREYARWLLNQFRVEDADKQLQAASALNANDNEIQALMGLSSRYKKDFAGAQAIFLKLDITDPGNVIYQWNRALSMAESTDKTVQSQAVNLATQVAQNQNHAKNPEALAVLTWCLFKAGRLDDADRAGGECLKLGNGMAGPDTRYYLANILVARDKKKEARDMLKPAMESRAYVYKKDAEALYNKLLAEFPEEKKPDDKKP